MTEQELRIWVGVEEGFTLRQKVIDGMRDIPVPTDDATQIAAFQAFLVCSGAPAQPNRTRDTGHNAHP